MKSLLILPLFIATTVLAQEPDSSSALFKMREAELNFARESVMFGRQAAFVNNFADESVVFTDKWVTNGRQFSKERKAVPVVLKWEPEFMDISASRDFGISTGPWEIQEYRPNTNPLSTGYFLTVWKKQSDGDWKVILDAGSQTPSISGPKHVLSFPPGDDKSVVGPPVMNIEQSRKELIERDNLYCTEWKKNPGSSTFTSFFGAGVRIQRNGYLPTTNPDTIKVWMNQRNKTLIWEPIGSGAASSGDLGYTYGMLHYSGSSSVNKDYYVRIWKREPGTYWKITLEMLSLE